METPPPMTTTSGSRTHVIWAIASLGHERIAVPERRVCIGIVGKRDLCKADNTGRGAVLFQAPFLAAAAYRSLAILDFHVADLTGCAVNSGQDLSADNDAAADARAERDHNYVVMSLSATVPLLAKSRDIGVIGHFNGNAAQQIGQLAADIQDAPSEVDAFIDNSALYDRSGNADAHTFDVFHGQVMLFKFLLDCLGDVRKDVLAVVFRSGGDLPVLNELAVR